jgi:hypothetical protein
VRAAHQSHTRRVRTPMFATPKLHAAASGSPKQPRQSPLSCRRHYVQLQTVQDDQSVSQPQARVATARLNTSRNPTGLQLLHSLSECIVDIPCLSSLDQTVVAGATRNRHSAQNLPSYQVFENGQAELYSACCTVCGAFCGRPICHAPYDADPRGGANLSLSPRTRRPSRSNVHTRARTVNLHV